MSAQTNQFRLNRKNRRFLGVCASVADYLEVPTVVVRILCLLACLIWPTLILVYFIAYWWLKQDREDAEGAVRHMIAGSRPAQHFRNVDYHKQLYRNPYNARVAGVCSGIADYLEVRAVWVRFFTLMSFFFFGPFTFFAYGVCWVVLERNPEAPSRRRRHRHRRRHHRDEQTAAYEEVPDASPEESAEFAEDAQIAMSISECSEVFRTLEGRLRELEAFMTSKKFRLHCEINRI
ncbi:MAG: PspC domain-containing protein [Gammaproteobacteria bacterium]|nr:PspC domain-containing protein [Pseudomonadales bacterium]MCP5330115.1 PspC domain-containing protein [Pseudomonadales bacterium]